MHVQEPQEPCVFSTPGLYSYIRSNKKTMENGHWIEKKREPEQCQCHDMFTFFHRYTSLSYDIIDWSLSHWSQKGYLTSHKGNLLTTNQYVWLATNHFKTNGCPQTKFWKMVAHQAHQSISTILVGHPPFFAKNGCSPTNLKKMVGHQPNSEKKKVVHCSPTTFKKNGWPPTIFFKYGCPPTTLKQIGWPSTNFEKMLLTNHFPKRKWLATHQLFQNGSLTDQLNKNGWPSTKFSKMVAPQPLWKKHVGHRPNFEKLVAHRPNKKNGWPPTNFFKNGRSPTTFKKKWLATNRILKNGCPLTTLTQIDWPSTNFEKMLLTNHFQKKWLATDQPFQNWSLTDQLNKKWLATNQVLKNGCSPTNFDFFRWPPTKFWKLAAHRPNLTSWSVANQNFWNWLLTDQFQKFWSATDQIQFDKCAHLWVGRNKCANVEK